MLHSLLPFVIGVFEIMAKRKKVVSLRGQSTTAATEGLASAGASVTPLELDQSPSPRQRMVVTVIVIAHFSALLIALSANLAPSLLQGKLTSLLSTYLVTTNQAYNAFPLELTHAEAFDFPVYVEFRAADDSSERWEKLALPGIPNRTSSSARWRVSRWPNFSRVVRLIATDQPGSEILSDITARLVAVAEQQTGDSFREVRWVAPKVLSYDEDARVANGEASMLDDALAPTIMFSATIVHGTAGQLSLVPQQAPLRTSKPIPTGEPRP